ncbi:prostate stem cell antigen-like [Bombina bombina]|uniref:prostate stem cell antigen-like n=1 Tax=Bombina bombina TaxID=8345 RepID=UPI00235B27EE|nr:prostate stem cell antigen-like [Bombina bombina]
MNIIFVLLISPFALWSIASVTSLQCYNCKDMKNNTECNSLPVETCAPSFNVCLATTEKLFNGAKISKKCAVTGECNQVNYDIKILARKMECCGSDLCNRDAPWNGQTALQSNVILATACALVLCVIKNM